MYINLNKALHRIKWAHKAWYERLTSYLLTKSFKRDGIDKTLFYQCIKKGILVSQVYLEDIIFGSTLDSHARWFANIMSNKAGMSMIGELTMFLCLRIQQLKEWISLSQKINIWQDLVEMYGLKDS